MKQQFKGEINILAPYELAEGEKYSNVKSIRRIEKIDAENDLVTYIENPESGHVLGRCGIDDFCEWAKYIVV